VNVLIGVGCGLAFSLHLYALSYFIPGLGLPMVQFTNMGLLWSVCVLLGMIVPAEVLIFRGVAFSILHDEFNYTLREVIVRVTALNVLVYLVIVAGWHVIHPY